MNIRLSAAGLLLSVVFFMSGCGVLTTYSAIYTMNLSEVERPANASDRYGEPTISSTSEVTGKSTVTKFSFEDELIQILWNPAPSAFYFEVTNKTEHSMKIIWDEATFVFPNGNSGRIMHSGIKFSQKDAPQPPTVIARGARISDLVYPTSLAVLGEKGWVEKPIYTTSSMLEPVLINIKQELVGKSYQVLLPFEIQGTVNEYMFTFKVEDITVQQN